MAKLQTTQPELYINDEDEMIVPQSEHCVKVSNSQKQILKFSFEPKKTKIFLYFCPSFKKPLKSGWNT